MITSDYNSGWSIPTVKEKSNPDRIETCLKLSSGINITTETTTVTTGTILKMIHNNPKISFHICPMTTNLSLSILPIAFKTYKSLESI